MRATLAALSMLALTCCPGLARSNVVSIGDSKLYTAGSYGAFNAPFKAATMGFTRGSDFADQTDIDPGRFPSGTVMKWTWPKNSDGCKNNICGFMAIDFGDYDGTRVARPIPSKPVSAISTLFLTEDAVFGPDDRGDIGGYDAIVDLFLTRVPGGGQNHLFEIEIFLHTPEFASAWAQKQKLVGVCTDSSGVTWKITRAGNDLLFVPSSRGDIQHASIDVRGLMQALIDARQITGGEYFNGLGVGVEPKSSSGTMTIQSLTISYR